MATTYEEVMNTLNEMDEYAIKQFQEFVDKATENFLWLEEIEKDAESYRVTGILNFDLLTSCSVSECIQETNTRINSLSKENNKSVAAQPSRGNRQLRSALKEPSQIVNVQGSSNTVQDHIVVKTERLTCDTIENVRSEDESLKIIKKEQIEMPPPKPARVLKKKKEVVDKLESVKIKTERLTKKLKKGMNLGNLEESSVRESDIQFQEKKTDLVVIDSDEEAPRRTRARAKTRQVEEVVETTRSTRTKTRAKKNLETAIENQKQSGDSSSEDQNISKTGSKSNKNLNNDAENEKQICDSSSNDEAITKPAPKSKKNFKNDYENQKRLRDSSSEDQAKVNNSCSKNAKSRKLDETQDVSKNLNAMKSAANINNVTVVLEGKANEDRPEIACNVTRVIETVNRDAEELALKDLMTDDEDIINSPLQDKKLQTIKQIFSPYDNSPVKKKVAAFEKLGAASNSTAGRITRGARQLGTPTNKQIPKSAAFKATPGSVERPYNKYNTPSTASALKSSSAYKSSQAEFRERELKRQQKEKEAMAKKEALLQAQIEEKRRKREERQLKAQQTRDALTKNKMSALESADRAKQEKIKHVFAKKDEQLAKKREQSAQKQAAAYKRAYEEKQKDPARPPTPDYLKYKMPLLPTADCYDSDDSQAPTAIPPYWQLQIQRTATVMQFGQQLQRKMFGAKPQTVDLQKIFPTICRTKLKRTSSAIWNRSDLSKLAEEGED